MAPELPTNVAVARPLPLDATPPANSAVAPAVHCKSIRLSWKKKAVFSLIATISILVAAEMVLALIGIKPRILTEDPFVDFRSGVPLFIREGEFFRTNPTKLWYFNDQRFPVKKTANSYRIFCLGGSTTYGHPYNDETSYVSWLRERLKEAEPDRDWQVVNCGGISYASYRNCRLMQELAALQPDLFVVYDGHNEFLEERTYGSLKDSGALRQAADLVLTRTRIGAAMMRLCGNRSSLPRQSVLKPEVDSILKSTVGTQQYHRDPEWHLAVIEHFSISLDRAAMLARYAGAQMILVKPASNLRSFRPFKSELGGLIPADETKWRQLVARGRRLREEGDYEGAGGQFAIAAELDTRHAMTQWEAGDSLFQAGDRPAARQFFVRAIDEDICPLRATTAILEAIEEAAERNRLPLVDFQKLLDDELEQTVGHRIPGEESFLDHVHPIVEKNRLIAWGLFDQLVKLRIVRDRPSDGDVVQRISKKILGSIDPEKQALALINVAQILVSAGKDEEALNLTERAEELSPGLALVASYRGRMLEKLGRSDAACEWFLEAIHRDPQALMPLSRLAAAHLGRREWGTARDYYERAIPLVPETAPDTFRAELHIGLGTANSGLERWQAAVHHFRQALRFTSESSEARAGLSNALSKAAATAAPFK